MRGDRQICALRSDKGQGLGRVRSVCTVWCGRKKGLVGLVVSERRVWCTQGVFVCGVCIVLRPRHLLTLCGMYCVVWHVYVYVCRVHAAGSSNNENGTHPTAPAAQQNTHKKKGVSIQSHRTPPRLHHFLFTQTMRDVKQPTTQTQHNVSIYHNTHTQYYQSQHTQTTQQHSLTQSITKTKKQKKKKKSPNKGLISADRSNKTTLPLTIPSPIKVVCKGFNPRPGRLLKRPLQKHSHH